MQKNPAFIPESYQLLILMSLFVDSNVETSKHKTNREKF